METSLQLSIWGNDLFMGNFRARHRVLRMVGDDANLFLGLLRSGKELAKRVFRESGSRMFYLDDNMIVVTNWRVIVTIDLRAGIWSGITAVNFIREKQYSIISAVLFQRDFDPIQSSRSPKKKYNSLGIVVFHCFDFYCKEANGIRLRHQTKYVNRKAIPFGNPCALPIS